MGRSRLQNKARIKGKAGCEIKGFDDEGVPIVDFEKMSEHAKARREQFVREYFVDFNVTAALLRMGYAYGNHLKSTGFFLWNDAYVQWYLAQYRKTILEKAVVSRAEVFVGLLQEARSESASSTARTNAWKAIGKFLGMSVQKIEIASKGNAVMVVPLVGNGSTDTVDVLAWEKQAEGAQAQLKNTVRE